MKAFIWNSEGFRDTSKHRRIQESIRDFNLDVIALLETGKSSFPAHFLRNLSAGRDFSWFCLPPEGRSGGMLVGINLETLAVTDVEAGEFCVKFHLKAKDGFEWNFVAVYGAAQEAKKETFLAELVRICENSPIPLLVGGISILLEDHMKIIIRIIMRDGLFFSTPLSKVLV